MQQLRDTRHGIQDQQKGVDWEGDERTFDHTRITDSMRASVCERNETTKEEEWGERGERKGGRSQTLSYSHAQRLDRYE